MIGVNENNVPATYSNMYKTPVERLTIQCDTLKVARKLMKLAAEKCSENTNYNPWLFTKKLHRLLLQTRNKLEGVPSSENQSHDPLKRNLQNHDSLKLKLCRQDNTSNWHVDLPEPLEHLAINVCPIVDEIYYKIGRYYW